MTTETLADRVEALDGPWEKAPFCLVEEVYSAVFPEPELGPWYWRNKSWKRWCLILFAIENRHRRGDHFYLLEWLYRGRLPEMIHADPKKAIAAALRAMEQGE